MSLIRRPPGRKLMEDSVTVDGVYHEPKMASTTTNTTTTTTTFPASLAISTELEALLDIRSSNEEEPNAKQPETQLAQSYQLADLEKTTPITARLGPLWRDSSNQGFFPAASRDASLSIATRDADTEPLEEISFANPEGDYDEDDDVGNKVHRLRMKHKIAEENPHINRAPLADGGAAFPISPSDHGTSSGWERSVEDGEGERRERARGGDDQGPKPLHLRYLSKVLGRKRSSRSPQGYNEGREFVTSHRYSQSSRSEATESTWDAASSMEPHISISSTIYSASVHSLFESPLSCEHPDSVIDIASRSHGDGSPMHSSAPVSPTTMDKPPIPTTPKPAFYKPYFSRPSSSWARPGNSLSPQERAELVQKTRKLTRVFGQTPRASVITPTHDSFSSGDRLKGHGRGWMSVSYGVPDRQSSGMLLSDDSIYTSGRRHSAPFLPQDDESILSDDATQIIDFQIPHSAHDSRASMDSLTPEQLADEERRRKREKLAKLHRFLGSRVPTELVLGIGPATTLPPVASDDEQAAEARTRLGLRRRRSSSFADYSTTYMALADRLKSDLDLEEKAVNVRRAAKMEKLFGVAPPQTLYHTRHTPLSAGETLDNSAIPTSSLMINNLKKDSKRRKATRPGTAESSQQLLPKNECHLSETECRNIYISYRESLNSLFDIVDRDDRESIEQLHEFIRSDAPNEDEVLRTFAHNDEGRKSFSSPRLERRRSLPASISSDQCSNPPEVSIFEQKRRRAAKLTNFFGVYHHEIMRHILESIEKGVMEESGKGTLTPEEVDDLLQKLDQLKSRTRD